MLGFEYVGLDAQRDEITFRVIGDQTVAAQGARSRPSSRRSSGSNSTIRRQRRKATGMSFNGW
jgi:hypothetical protein